MSGLYDLVSDTVNKVISEYRAAAVDGVIDFSEKTQLAVVTVSGAFSIFSHLGSHGTSAERRACVVEAVERFVNEVLVPYDIQQIPNWLEPMFDGFLEKGAPQYVDQFLKENIPGFE